MARSSIAAVLVLLVIAPVAEAQPAVFRGLLTGHVGPVFAGDIREGTTAPGASVAVVDEHGLGAEIDVGYSGDFNTRDFRDSSIVIGTLNVIALSMHEQVRPFVVAGVGALRVRARVGDGQSPITQTDLAWNAGAGVLYMVNEVIGLRGDVRFFQQFGRQTALPLGDNGTLDFVRAAFGVTFTWPLP